FTEKELKEYELAGENETRSHFLNDWFGRYATNEERLALKYGAPGVEIIEEAKIIVKTDTEQSKNISSHYTQKAYEKYNKWSKNKRLYASIILIPAALAFRLIAWILKYQAGILAKREAELKAVPERAGPGKDILAWFSNGKIRFHEKATLSDKLFVLPHELIHFILQPFNLNESAEEFIACTIQAIFAPITMLVYLIKGVLKTLPSKMRVEEKMKIKPVFLSALFSISLVEFFNPHILGSGSFISPEATIFSFVNAVCLSLSIWCIGKMIWTNRLIKTRLGQKIEAFSLKRIKTIGFVALGGFIIDQGVKLYVHSHLPLQSFEELKSLTRPLNLVNTLHTERILEEFIGDIPVSSLILFFALPSFLYFWITADHEYISKSESTKPLQKALSRFWFKILPFVAAFLLGGAMSNLLDGIRLGGAVDYIYAPAIGIVWNLADVMVISSMLLLMFSFVADKQGKIAEKDRIAAGGKKYSLQVRILRKLAVAGAAIALLAISLHLFGVIDLKALIRISVGAVILGMLKPDLLIARIKGLLSIAATSIANLLQLKWLHKNISSSDLLMRIEIQRVSDPTKIKAYKELLHFIKIGFLGSKGRMSRYFKDEAETLIALDKNKVMGGLQYKIDSGINGRSIFICNLALNKKYRNNGIGALFLDKVEEIAREKHVLKIYTIPLKSARRFYENNGYRIVYGKDGKIWAEKIVNVLIETSRQNSSRLSSNNNLKGKGRNIAGDEGVGHNVSNLDKPGMKRYLKKSTIQHYKILFIMLIFFIMMPIGLGTVDYMLSRKAGNVISNNFVIKYVELYNFSKNKKYGPPYIIGVNSEKREILNSALKLIRERMPLEYKYMVEEGLNIYTPLNFKRHESPNGGYRFSAKGFEVSFSHEGAEMVASIVIHELEHFLEWKEGKLKSHPNASERCLAEARAYSRQLSAMGILVDSEQKRKEYKNHIDNSVCFYLIEAVRSEYVKKESEKFFKELRRGFYKNGMVFSDKEWRGLKQKALFISNIELSFWQPEKNIGKFDRAKEDLVTTFEKMSRSAIEKLKFYIDKKRILGATVPKQNLTITEGITNPQSNSASDRFSERDNLASNKSIVVRIKKKPVNITKILLLTIPFVLFPVLAIAQMPEAGPVLAGFRFTPGFVGLCSVFAGSLLLRFRKKNKLFSSIMFLGGLGLLFKGQYIPMAYLTNVSGVLSIGSSFYVFAHAYKKPPGVVKKKEGINSIPVLKNFAKENPSVTFRKEARRPFILIPPSMERVASFVIEEGLQLRDVHKFKGRVFAIWDPTGDRAHFGVVDGSIAFSPNRVAKVEDGKFIKAFVNKLLKKKEDFIKEELPWPFPRDIRPFSGASWLYIWALKIKIRKMPRKYKKNFLNHFSRLIKDPYRIEPLSERELIDLGFKGFGSYGLRRFQFGKSRNRKFSILYRPYETGEKAFGIEVADLSITPSQKSTTLYSLGILNPKEWIEFGKGVYKGIKWLISREKKEVEKALASNKTVERILVSMKNIFHRISEHIAAVRAALDQLVNAGYIRSYWSEKGEILTEVLFLHLAVGALLGFFSAPQGYNAILFIPIGVLAMFFASLTHVLIHIFSAFRFYKQNEKKNITMPSQDSRFKLERLAVVIIAPLTQIFIIFPLFLIGYKLLSLTGCDILSEISLTIAVAQCGIGIGSIVTSDNAGALEIREEMGEESLFKVLRSKGFRKAWMSL
ncbi:MAG: GNAT family N-acetyltransferase, partial [Candidatus Omnitrophica bacterium]|nr:GNAT family N-acetyltransferase [Candidatus Omnitrophota bacterium]